MDKSLIKEEMVMEHNTEMTEEQVMQIVATQSATATIGGTLIFIVLGILIYKTFKNNLPFQNIFSFKWNI